MMNLPTLFAAAFTLFPLFAAALFPARFAALGDLHAGMLLDFFLEELGPVIYNAAITDAQTRLLSNVTDLTGDLYEKPFSYWPRQDAKRKPRR